MDITKKNVSVSICMSTYNHEKFIEESINSVLEQVCNFDFEVILSNDCSTDQTNQVIMKIIETHSQGNKIKYFNQAKNIGINGNLIYTLERAEGKYIALLEGDDYWTDKQKLQKQFDFLENNPYYSICTGAYESVIPDQGSVVRKFDENVEGITYEFNNIRGFRSNYLNMFFRADSIQIDRLRTFTYSGDNVIFLMCLSKGNGYFFNQVLGFRRTHPNGLWTSKTVVDRIKMGYEQIIGLYQFPEYKKAIRPELFYTYLDLLSLENKNDHYIIRSFKLIRSFGELLYFIKIVSLYLKKNNFR